MGTFTAIIKGISLGFQRSDQEEGTLSAEQICKLNAIQFDWESGESKNNEQWDRMFQLLKKYKLEHGHCCMLQQEHYHGEPLGDWVSSQMGAYRENKIQSNC